MTPISSTIMPIVQTMAIFAYEPGNEQNGHMTELTDVSGLRMINPSS
jgi:hypothetical protein